MSKQTAATTANPVALAKTTLPANPETIDEHLAVARHFQDAILYHAVGMAASRIAYGLQLIETKAKVKALGYKWTTWYRDNLDRPKFSYESAAQHMQVAKAWLEKVGKSRLFSESSPMALLTEQAGEALQEDKREAFIASVASVTTANTWHQLQLDMGLLKEDDPLAGAGGYHAPRHLLDEFARENGLASAVYLDWPKETQAAFREWRKQRERGSDMTDEQRMDTMRYELRMDLGRAVMALEKLYDCDFKILEESVRRDAVRRIEHTLNEIKSTYQKGR